MYVQVLADTYEKVDAAVSLIELLVNPVSVSVIAINLINIVHPHSLVVSLQLITGPTMLPGKGRFYINDYF